jgi:hypothetical protein
MVSCWSAACTDAACHLRCERAWPAMAATGKEVHLSVCLHAQQRSTSAASTSHIGRISRAFEDKYGTLTHGKTFIVWTPVAVSRSATKPCHRTKVTRSSDKKNDKSLKST